MNIFNFSKLKLPIIQAPMAGGFNTPELASVVANSGGVGSFGFSFTSPEKIDAILRTTNTHYTLIPPPPLLPSKTRNY